jgi:histidinol-phosphate/aromatic aminotransferase/cobyric acid decarboxylase-like protein
LNGRRASFDTNCLAQRTAEAWPSQTEFIARRRSRLLADRERLAAVLTDVGLLATPSVTGALLVRVTRASEVAAELLSRCAIAVCDCTPYGLPDHLRISGVGEPHAPRLRTALEEVLARRRIPGGREA